MKHSLTIRSKMQTEAVVSYRLGQDVEDARDTEIETYLFIPRALGINPKSYPKYMFYRDLQTISALEVKATSLRDLAAEDGFALKQLRRVRDRLLSASSSTAARDCSIVHRVFSKSLSDTIERQLEAIAQEKRPQRRAELAYYFLEQSRTLRSNLRALPPLDASLALDYQPIFAVCDEFISLQLEQASCQIHEKIDDSDSALQSELLGFAQSETAYRKTRCYPSLPTPRRHAEDLVFRREALRDHVDSALYLTAHNKREGVLIRELFMSVAAGIAMIFATAIAFLAHVQFENWTTTFFVILVISYMFKDRIKAQSQAYLTAHSQRYLFDYKTRIFDAASEKPFGYKRESFEFITPVSMDPAILAQRNRFLPGGGAQQQTEEKVMRYKRRIGFYASNFGCEYAGFPMAGICNRLRFDCSRFVRKMEDTTTKIYLPDEGGYNKIRGRRVTHIHMIVKTRHPDSTRLDHYRIVLNRNGIRRIQQLSTE